ncbi:MAG: hypothetical protein K2X87_04875 [Gemmataceae bacterium]|nr:hypothetical protein [Gemmataceae bacterium]
MLSGPNHPRTGADGASLTDRPAVKYVGVRAPGGAVVAGEDDAGRVRPLPLRTDLRNHSPTGFEWGYSGSGPAQLALAILADVVGAERAQEGGLYQRFKFDVVAGFPADRWELTREAVLAWVAENERPEGSA